MSFIKEVAEKFAAAVTGGYEIVNFAGECVYIEGAKRVLFLAADKIRVLAASTIIEVSGENLEIAEIESGSLVIKGRIDSINAEKSR